MTDQEYKALSVKEFSKAAKVYETDDAGVYKMCNILRHRLSSFAEPR